MNSGRKNRLVVFLGIGTWLAVVATLSGTLILGCNGGGARSPEAEIARIARAATTSCSFTVTQNVYDGPNWWGTITFKNNGPSTASNFTVEFDVPDGVHCNDYQPPNATLSPLGPGGLAAGTISNHCVFTFSSSSLAPGASKTFNYSTDSRDFTAATKVVVSDSTCGGGGISCNTFSVVQNSYNGSQWWGTISLANDGPSTSSSYVVEFDLPNGAHCTAEPDAIPEGATLSPLTSTGDPRRTTGSHCVFTWANTTSIAPGDPARTFHYSADSQSFTAASNLVIRDSACSGGGGGGGSGGTGGGSIVSTGTDVGTTPGELSVGASGTASYFIPLWSPEGRNGMTPRLALSYSSAGGDDAVGYGWALSGAMSMIHRCPVNSQRAERPTSVKFDNVNDRLCLDGKALVKINDIANGAAGAEYRTEPESFTKIVIDAADANGPIRFTVFTRDGLKHYYASASVTQVDSGLVVGGKRDEWTVSDATRNDADIARATFAAQYGWLRGSTEDRFHNTIWFKYIHPTTKDAIGGRQEPLIDKIEYADVAGFPTRSIKFVYDGRPEISKREGFIGGLGFANTKQLKSIDMRVARPGTQTLSSARFYAFTQETSAATGRSLLQQVKEWDGNPTTVTGRTPASKKPTVFTYEPGLTSFQNVPVPAKNMRKLEDGDFWGIQPVDLDGDGRDDIVYRARPEGAGSMEPPRWYVRRSSGSGFSDPIDLNLPEGQNFQTGDAVIADFSGASDLPDLAVPAGAAGDNVFAYYENQGFENGVFTFKLLVKESAGANKALAISDFHGKGFASLLRPSADGRWTYRVVENRVDGAVISSSSDPLAVAWSTDFAQAGWSAFSADIDFDGAAEFLVPFFGSTFANHLSVARQKVIPTGAPTAGDWEVGSTSTTLLTSTQANLVNHFFLDHNGDGLPDALRLRKGEDVPALIINSGGGFATPEPVTDLLNQPTGNVKLGAGTNAKDLIDPGIRILDFNGDGRQDVLLVDNGMPRDSVTPPPPTAPRQNLTLLLSQGNGFVVKDLGIGIGKDADGPVKPGSAAVHNYRQTQVLDINGDGLPDIVQFLTDTTFHALIQDGGSADLLTDVKDGMGKKTKITYLPMTNSEVYTPGGDCNFPVSCANTGDWLVRSHKVDNGIDGNQNEYEYHYENQRADYQGAGILGFTSWSVKDVAANTTVTEDFKLGLTKKGQVKALNNGQTTDALVFSHVGLPDTSTVKTEDPDFTRTRTTTYTYEFVATNGGLSYMTRPVVTTVIETETKAGATVELLNQELKLTYDPAVKDFGVPPSATTTTTTPAGTFKEEVSSTYVPPDAANWLLGLETSRTVVGSAPAGGQEIRSMAFGPDQTTGALTDMTIEPSDTTNDKRLVVAFARNGHGQVTSVTRTDRIGNARVESVGYDAHSVHPATYTNALGHVSAIETDGALGVLLSATDANSIRSSFDYDAFGRLRRVNKPGGGGQSVSYARDIESQSALADERFVTRVTTTVDGGGESRTIVNRLGQTIRQETKSLDGSFTYVTQSYNELGLVREATRPARLVTGVVNPGATTTLSYDSLGRMLSRTRPEEARDASGSLVTSATTTRSYTDFVSKVTDDFGRVKKFTSDPFGRVIKSEAEKGSAQWIPTEYTYGPFGVLLFVDRRDALNSGSRQTEAEYDNLGRRISLTDPDTGTRETKFNAFGEVRVEIDGNNAVTTYSRDALGRVTKKNDADGETTFTWDTNGKGLLAQTMSPFGVKRQFLYDTSGRMFREIWTMIGQTFQVDYAFDAFGRVEKVKYPSNASGFSRLIVRNTYDPDSGALSKVQNDSSSQFYWELKSTQVDGQIDEEKFGNGLVSDYDYSDQTGRVGSIKTTLSGSAVRSWSYDFWKDGNLRRRSDLKANQHERFEYDTLDRVKSWFAVDATGNPLSGGWTVNYTIDDFGNLERRQLTVGSTTTQDSQFSLIFGTNRVQTSPWGSYTYDGSGNQTGRPGNETVTYSAFDLPKTMTGPQPATFLYDAFGTRAKKRKSNTEYTLYVSGLYEKRVVGSTIDHVFYVMGGGRIVAQVRRTEGGSSDTTSYLHDDHLGSIDAVTNSVGTVIESTKRDPYGNRITNFDQPSLPSTIAASTNRVRLGFTAHEQDDELGLINMRGRVYDPRLARFLTPDPIVQAPLDGQSHNRYTYVLNNPLNLTDPSGYESTTCFRGQEYDSSTGTSTGRPCLATTQPAEVDIRITDRLGGGSGGSTEPSLTDEQRRQRQEAADREARRRAAAAARLHRAMRPDAATNPMGTATTPPADTPTPVKPAENCATPCVSTQAGTTGATAATAHNLIKDGAVRGTYATRTHSLGGTDSMARDYYRRDSLRSSTNAGRVAAETIRPIGVHGGGGTAFNTRPSVDRAMRGARGAGPVGLAVGVGLATYDVATAPEGEGGYIAVRAGGAMGTGVAVGSGGAYMGAAFGSIFGPAGAVIGGLIGAVGGGWLGGEMGADLVDTAYRDNACRK